MLLLGLGSLWWYFRIACSLASFFINTQKRKKIISALIETNPDQRFFFLNKIFQYETNKRSIQDEKFDPKNAKLMNAHMLAERCENEEERK